MAESNRSIVERFEKAFAANDIAGIQDACHPDLVDHNPLPDQKPGLSGFKETVAFYKSVFPDSQVETIRRSPNSSLKFSRRPFSVNVSRVSRPTPEIPHRKRRHQCMQ